MYRMGVILGVSVWPAVVVQVLGVWSAGHPLRSRCACSRPLALREGEGDRVVPMVLFFESSPRGPGSSRAVRGL